MYNVLHALLGRPHVGHTGVRIAIGGAAGALLLGGFRAVLHYIGFTAPFHIRFSFISYVNLFHSTGAAEFPDAALLPAAAVAVLLVLLIVSVWEFIYKLP